MRHRFETDRLLSSLHGHEKYEHVFNMDKTFIYIDMNPKTTITLRGERDVDVVQGMLHLNCVFFSFTILIYTFRARDVRELLPRLRFLVRIGDWQKVAVACRVCGREGWPGSLRTAAQHAAQERRGHVDRPEEGVL